ncbi:unnamed protein product (macronuclear) [Paramecium tetraurelia]|uniref:CHHC U11-48K-type domain-containing protein n=1 Tax=Paramecium tetraurelia TaxID=5888 RepID=A0EAH2_PARTE|nr:uncharacterized protein GSPATT00025021001 [Paramecium tetraurelia]CAK92289.1 unnamed protein product [Paramecium tetraurelia]|eukprot:XP_001459686.1 hypothetical protein (macronuclear) [Paramecium tetraurelia strain d4-2]
MSFKTGDERHDFQVKCPYNPSHQMPNSKLFYHISQGCQDKARLEHLYEHCPYNFMHVILKANMDAHLRQCANLNKNTEEGNLMEEMQKVIKEQKKEQRKAQQQQKQQQQQNTQIPGVIVPEYTKKKKRVRNKKKKEEPKTENKDGMPVWGESSDDEKNEVQDVIEQFAQTQVTEQKQQDSDDEWDEVPIKQKGRNGKTREKE